MFSLLCRPAVFRSIQTHFGLRGIRCLSSGHRSREHATPLMMSYTHGASDIPLLGETLGDNFDKTVHHYGDSEALIVENQRVKLTYRQLQEKVDALGAGLVQLGLQPGDRIGIWAPNSEEWVLTQFATAKLGLILVNLNPAYRTGELAYSLKAVGCRALITAESLKSSNYINMINELIPELPFSTSREVSSADFPDLRHIIRLGTHRTAGMINFNDLLLHGPSSHLQILRSHQKRVQFDDPVNIQFTSGTTGQPKGAILSHHNVLNNGFMIGEILKYTNKDKACIPVPLYHCFGMVIGNLACTTHGSCIVYSGSSFDPLAVLQTVQKHRCTSLLGVPTMFIAELNHPEFKQFDLSSLRTGVMSGSPCPIEIMKRVTTEMHMKDVTICYGMTETSPVTFQSHTDDPIEKRVSTVGRIHPHAECKIVNGEGEIVPRGTAGEVLTRGYAVMLGYWNDEEKTRQSIDKSRWMHTGDIGEMDEQGYVKIVGRIKDMIIRGGENIYPKEIEDLFHSHPSVDDVHVIGVPDAKYGEEICAWIRLREGHTCTEETLKVFVKRSVAHFKVPKHIRFVSSFPMTVTGKIQKFLMREIMIQELNQQSDDAKR